MRQGFKPYSKKGNTKSEIYAINKKNDRIETISDGSRYPIDVIKFESITHSDHPTQKPVGLLEYLINTYTEPGDTVLDFTMGSGSTGVAAVNTGRKFIGIEKDLKYFEIAQKRIEEARQKCESQRT